MQNRDMSCYIDVTSCLCNEAKNIKDFRIYKVHMPACSLINKWQKNMWNHADIKVFESTFILP